MYFVVAYAYSGLSPVRARPWRANLKKAAADICGSLFMFSGIILVCALRCLRLTQ
jgi:hypothetical protein